VVFKKLNDLLPCTVEQNLAYLHQGEVGEGVSQGAEYDYRQGFGSADRIQHFFKLRIRIQVSSVNLIVTFLENFL
jgi:hypothetical protein